jgi:Low molecular weight phosphotyrosine protein phosphatase
MAEWGIDLSREFPKPLTDQAVRAADVVITMGCGDACPFHPGKRYEDWQLRDPAGRPIEVVRGIRDQIDARVQQLLGELVAASGERRISGQRLARRLMGSQLRSGRLLARLRWRAVDLIGPAPAARCRGCPRRLSRVLCWAAVHGSASSAINSPRCRRDSPVKPGWQSAARAHVGLGTHA